MRPYRNRLGVPLWGHHLPFSHQPWSRPDHNCTARRYAVLEPIFQISKTHEPGKLGHGIAHNVQRVWVELATTFPCALPLCPRQTCFKSQLHSMQINYPRLWWKTTWSQWFIGSAGRWGNWTFPRPFLWNGPASKKESLEKGFRGLAMSITVR